MRPTPTLDWYTECVDGILTRLESQASARIAVLDIPMIGEDLTSDMNRRVDSYNQALRRASLSWIIVGIMTLFQRRTPPELMGRTGAAFTVAYAVPQTVAIALGAGLIAVLNYRILLLVIAGLMTLAAGYLLTRRERAGRPAPVSR